MGEGEGADGWGPEVSGRERREREGGEALTGGARRSVGGSGARIGPPGPEERGGCRRARAGLEFGLAEGGERDFLFLFLF
jgi:hypothetical protein